MSRSVPGLCCLLVVLAVAVPARAQTVDRTVNAGSMAATVEPDPFRIRVGPLEGLSGETLSANGIPRAVS